MAKKITRREFIATTAGASAFPRVGSTAPSYSRRPNILFILADDLGYGDLSCYGRPDYRTPVLDDLARQGTKFLSAYAAAPVCTPTRCAFVTGRYPHRLEVGLQEPLREVTPDIGLPPDHPTVASLLRNNAYRTALIGKWHLGFRPEFGANRHGFEEFFGILAGASDYFTHQSGSGKPDLWENLTPVQRLGYLTDILTDRAIEFIKRPSTRPFYLSLHYTAPHAPWEGPDQATMAHYHGSGPMTDGGSLKIFASMVKSMDRGIGRVLTALKQARLERNTLVIFTSDNGGERYSHNWPFSFQKFDLWEGGIRVPAIVRWPGVIPGGQTTEQAVTTMDWTATILAVTETKPDPSYPLDGEDVMAVCRGRRTVYDRTLFWRTKRQDAARIGNWKYLKESGKEYLFDLAVDLGEKVDLKSRHVEVFNKLKDQFFAWNKQMLPNP